MNLVERLDNSCICVGERGQGRNAPSPPHGSYSGTLENIQANLKMNTFLLFFRDQTNPYHTNLKGKPLVKTFFRDHSGRFFPRPKLYCSPTDIDVIKKGTGKTVFL